MFSISRTVLSEPWHTSPQPALKLARGTTKPMIPSRLSVSTINTDLFPELITWSNILEGHLSESFSQRIPTDVNSKQEHDVDTVHEVHLQPLALTLILDPTAMAFGFDQSCLEGLDDNLAYSPIDAFEEACWTEGTYSRIPTPNTPISNPEKSGGRREPLSPLASSSDDSDSESEDCVSFIEHNFHLDIVGDGGLSSDMNPMGDFITYKDESSLYYRDNEGISFMFFETALPPPPYPKDSVGGFPIPTIPRKSVPSRIAAFCANIPNNLTFVRSSST